MALNRRKQHVPVMVQSGDLPTPMKPAPRVPAVWLMGLANTTTGLWSGLVFFVFPQLLAEHHVPATSIASITAGAMFANFWSVFFGPVLDVRFSRRWYATTLAIAAAALAFTAIVTIENLLLLRVALATGTACAMLSSAALCGWLSHICPQCQTSTLSAWLNVAVFAGMGITSAVGGPIMHALTAPLAAGLLGLLILVPCAVFPFMPAPGPDRRLAAESFRQFNGEVLSLLSRRDVILALILFISPCGSFALTSMLGGFGQDFGASQEIISFAGGAGAIVPGLIGCLLFPLLARRVPLRYLYLANGTLGAIFTLSLLVLPRAPWTFLLALTGEYLFQAVAFSTQCGIAFQVIGPNNPLAATNFICLMASTNIPVTYMLLVDGRAYAATGLAGTLAADAGIGIAACLIFGVVFRSMQGREVRRLAGG